MSEDGPTQSCPRWRGSRSCFFGLALTCWVLWPVALLAQGSFEPLIVRTGTGTVLQTNSVFFSSPAGDPNLRFNFGFASSEQATPGAFLDSFTISLSSSLGIFYLLTADASGVVWAPVTAGGLALDPDQIGRQVSTFRVSPEGQPVLAAYDVIFSLPQGWEEVPLSVHFDFFENQDSSPSIAYAGFTMIPEPSSLGLLLLGFSCYVARRRRT